MASLRVRNLAGSLLLETQVPKTLDDTDASLKDLMEEVSTAWGVPSDLIKLVYNGMPLESLEALEGMSAELVAVIDESPLYTWDIERNPDKNRLSVSGAAVTFERIDPIEDYVNVLSQSPVRQGIHFVEFHMHSVLDEQWCGVTMFPDRAGCRGGLVPGCFYYSGRRYASKGALDAFRERQHVLDFSHVQNGDVIGLLLDADRHVALFSLNGKFQGGCRLPDLPMYFCTALDEEGDTVELMRCPVEDFPVKLDDVISTPRFVNRDLYEGEGPRHVARLSPPIDWLDSDVGSSDDL
ncbi:unnamed protein product [Durusdinium trenchii]|uniref:Ubiquitin-like domain-containing protein n=1 Tax=Durusdinium trenchii TaxID=1381693 RepID=A0ABP0NT89_9DINO